jgi:hypothetical protein
MVVEWPRLRKKVWKLVGIRVTEEATCSTLSR